MPSFTEILGNPIGDLLKGVGDIIGRFVTDPNAKLAASQELVRVQAEMQAKLIDADVAFANAQAAVITSEQQHGSWLSKSWRPILMLTFTYIIAHNYVFATMFHLTTVPIPPDMWDLLKIGVGGYVIGRSVEKTAPAVATAIVKAKE